MAFILNITGIFLSKKSPKTWERLPNLKHCYHSLSLKSRGRFCMTVARCMFENHHIPAPAGKQIRCRCSRNNIPEEIGWGLSMAFRTKQRDREALALLKCLSSTRRNTPACPINRAPVFGKVPLIAQEKNEIAQRGRWIFRYFVVLFSCPWYQICLPVHKFRKF